HCPAIDGWHGRGLSGSNRVAHSVEGAEVEQLILLDRPAQGSAELLEIIVLLRRAGQVWVVGIQTVMAAESVRAAMEIVRPRFQTDIDHGALQPPKFGGGSGHHRDFLY